MSFDSVPIMPTVPGRWDPRLHHWIGRVPDTSADRWARRLSNDANQGRLWLAIATVLGLRKGSLRRGAIRGIGAMWVSSALVNLVIKRLFARVRPDIEARPAPRRLRRPPMSHSFPSGHASSAGAFVTG